MRPCVYAPYQLLIRAFTLINRRLTRLCLVMLQIPLCLWAPVQKILSKKRPWAHAKMQIFSFRPETPFLGKYSQKNKNCQSRLKFGIHTNSNMQNSMVMFTFSVFDQKYPFCLNLVQKIRIVSLS